MYAKYELFLTQTAALYVEIKEWSLFIMAAFCPSCARILHSLFNGLRIQNEDFLNCFTIDNWGLLQLGKNAFIQRFDLLGNSIING